MKKYWLYLKKKLLYGDHNDSYDGNKDDWQ